MASLGISFYRGNGKFVDWLIRTWTGSKFSHCEIMFEDGRMFSSDAWNGGTRWNISYDISKWEIVNIEANQNEIKALMDWCDFKQNKGYDWFGVATFILPFMKEDPNKWFCSELCAAGLIFINKLPKDTVISKLSPGRLYSLLTGNSK